MTEPNNSGYLNTKSGVSAAVQLTGKTGAAIDLAADRTFSGGAIVYVGTGGTLKVDLLGGGTGLEYENLPDGDFFKIPVTKVYSTANGTTASGLISHV